LDKKDDMLEDGSAVRMTFADSRELAERAKTRSGATEITLLINALTFGSCSSCTITAGRRQHLILARGAHDLELPCNQETEPRNSVHVERPPPARPIQRHRLMRSTCLINTHGNSVAPSSSQ
jgi:hypothetical protein